MRMAHFLRPNKGSELPSQAIWLDTETQPRPSGPHEVTHHLSFGWACFQRRIRNRQWSTPQWHRFSTANSFWDWVLSLLRTKTRLYLFAHNWAFDGPVLDVFGQLPGRGFKLHSAVIDSPPVILSWRSDHGTLECLDTLNWWRMGLAAIGESVGLPKLTMPDANASVEEHDTYCRRDVDVIRRVMHKWWTLLEHHDLGGFAKTLAGQAMRSYRHRFMEHPILIDTDPHALELARSAYFGGRVECFRMGRTEGPIWSYDVNSMYPHVMQSCEYPTVLQTRCRNPTPRELDKWTTDYCVIADTLLETDSPQYARLADARLTFPVGKFAARLTTPDIRAAIEQGHLHSVSEIAVYNKAPIFESYVDELYALRLKATEMLDGVNSWLVKILMNSLYGKFGQRGMVWADIGPAVDDAIKTWTEVDRVEGITYRMRQFGGVLQQREERPESTHSHPAIAAHVTASARRYLWNLMMQAGAENVIYCDTDSVYVTRAGSDRLQPQVNPSKLGALKCEGVSDWIVVEGLKDYETPSTKKVKGVRSKAVWVDNNTVIQEQWSSLVGLLRRGSLEAPVTRTITKILRREYTKGHVLSSGQVRPHQVVEW